MSLELNKEPPGVASAPKLYATVDEILEVMLEAIRSAKTSVRLEMYIYSDTPIGRQFRDALVEARHRGLTVQVMVDAVGSMMTLSTEFWAPLLEAGGEFRWFNPFRLRFGNFRNHRKLLACDESVAFVGGFNISTEYQGDGVLRGWHDLGLRVHGELASELARSFDLLFSVADFKPKRLTYLRKATMRKMVATPQGQLFLGGPGRGWNRHKTFLLHDIAGAQSIQIICAYFLPLPPIRRALIRAARKGQRVELILAGKSDILMFQLATRRLYESFMKAGIEVYEYQPQILHSKLIILDDVVYCGSANLDRRSFYVNYELVVRLDDRPVNQQARQIFQAALQHSLRIDPVVWKASRTWWNKCLEWFAHLILGRLDPLIGRYQLKGLK